MKKYLALALIAAFVALIVAFCARFFFQPKIDFSHISLPKTDYILVEKKNRRLSLYHQGAVTKQYKIALGPSPIGHKQQEGDGKTPEGIYHIAYKNPKSAFHLSLKITFPSPQDTERAAKNTVSAGSNIMIHGLGPRYSFLGKNHIARDWTLGCIAVTDTEIEEIYHTTPIGCPVKIRP
jgi:murein L,D-transpeptidase YafK